MSIKRGVYHSGPLADLIRRVLNLVAPQGVQLVVVAAGGLEGMKLALDLQAEKDYWLGTYEPELQETIADLVQPGEVAYDVGANIGFISLLLALKVGKIGRVFAFEALPANLERLRVNLALNDLAAQVEVIPAAVVDREGDVRFLVGPSTAMGKVEGSSGRQDVSYPDGITIPGISLDEFVYQKGNSPPQVVKMDIEGGEVLALAGMERLMKEARPLIFLELHGAKSAEVAWRALIGAGYRICRMQRGYPEVPSKGMLEWKAYLVGIP